MMMELYHVFESIMEEVQYAFPDAETNPPSVQEAADWFIEQLRSRTSRMELPEGVLDSWAEELYSQTTLEGLGEFIMSALRDIERELGKYDDYGGYGEEHGEEYYM